ILTILDGSSADRISLEIDGLQIRISRLKGDSDFLDLYTGMTPAVAAANPSERGSHTGGSSKVEGDLMVSSPLLGDFLIRDSASAPAFVEPGKRIEEGDLLAIIEIAGNRNEVRAAKGGCLVSVL